MKMCIRDRILDEGVITRDELCALISQARQAGIRLILTGNVYPDYLDACVEDVYKRQAWSRPWTSLTRMSFWR